VLVQVANGETDLQEVESGLFFTQGFDFFEVGEKVAARTELDAVDQIVFLS